MITGGNGGVKGHPGVVFAWLRRIYIKLGDKEFSEEFLILVKEKQTGLNASCFFIDFHGQGVENPVCFS